MRPFFESSWRGFLVAASLAWTAPATRAQVPHIISYQGHVTVSGQSFHGTGRFKFALVNSNATVTYWTHDGTGLDGAEPATAIPWPVANGVFSINLGDTSVTNMQSLPTSVFRNSDVHLRTWFDDGQNGTSLLAPDKRITAVGYAIMAENVPDGSITAAKLAPGQSLVPSGGIVLSADPNSASLGAAGYVLAGAAGVTLLNSNNEAWQARTAPALGARQFHRAVWTGTEMLMWGGGGGGVFYNDGARYDVAADLWQPMSALNAPSVRWAHAAVWTGSEMLVWGGVGQFSLEANNRGDGGAYSPSSNAWRTLSTSGAPAPRTWMAYAWTGTELLVWGGIGNGYSNFGDGARYQVATDTWTPMSMNGAPSPRHATAFAWTGTELIVWGGHYANGSALSNAPPTGARYRPQSDTWAPMSTNGAPAWRGQPYAFWTGTKLLIWGGLDFNQLTAQGRASTLGTGALYDPVTDLWTPILPTNAPSSRFGGAAVWTGSEFWMWGGTHEDEAGASFPTTGSRYDPDTQTWTDITTANAPGGRANSAVVWTGNAVLIHGGWNGSTDLNSHHSWRPGTRPLPLYLYQRP